MNEPNASNEAGAKDGGDHASGRLAWWKPFPGLLPKDAWLRGLLLVACLQSIGFTAPLWHNSRLYPVLPITPGFPSLSAPWDRLQWLILLGSLIAAFRFYRPAILTFLGVSLFVVLEDQTRLQPWFYLYGVMLLLTLLPRRAVWPACRFILSAVYFWAGVMKCNAQFHAEVVPFFLNPLAAWFPAWSLPLIRATLHATPAVEIFISLALWMPRLRGITLMVVAGAHGVVLLTLGPWGNAFNPVVWPWNLAMVGLVLLLHSRGRQPEAMACFRASAWGPVVVALFWLLPLLHPFGRWDSYLSFSVYSGNTDRADFLVSADLRKKLPDSMQPFLKPIGPAAAQSQQGPYQFDFRNWGESQLKVPPPPESRFYLALGRFMAASVERPHDLQLLLAPRHGEKRILRAADLTDHTGR